MIPPKLPGLNLPRRLTRPGTVAKHLPPPGAAVLNLPDPTVPSDPVGAPAGRVSDRSLCAADAHGCPACPHPAVGPAIIGSPNVFVNSRPALRQADMGIHQVCCGPNTWTATGGSDTVFINDRPAHRKGDSDRHCGGEGVLIDGSPDVRFG
jgi:uncharacterized Zn-binding protein involved in type VI secretion